jgi:hypothetical protein
MPSGSTEGVNLVLSPCIPSKLGRSAWTPAPVHDRRRNLAGSVPWAEERQERNSAFPWHNGNEVLPAAVRVVKNIPGGFLPMNESSAAGPVDVAYYGRQTRSSLGWLVLSLFLGGSPLAVYFTTPEAPVADLVLALILGIPPFVMSLVDLGKAQAVILSPASRRLRYLEGFFARSTTRDFSYDEVREVHLTQKRITVHRGGATGWCEIRIVFSGARELVLEETSFERASHRARHLGAALGVQPRLDGKPLTASLQPAIRAGIRPPWAVVSYGILLAFAAFVFAVAVAQAWLRYLKQ